jgi:NAD(P)H-dependent FMN reductase
MITIISASNRDGNWTSIFANYCLDYLAKQKVDAQKFELSDLPESLRLKSVYEYDSSIFADISKTIIEPSNKFLFIVPEYNGSIPGILKLFIDGTEPKFFKGKKAALIGISAGRAGNLRGMDHLTDILHYLQVEVMAAKLPISKISELVKDEVIKDSQTIGELDNQLMKFINY